jgi:hypothetical protein
VLIGAWTVFIGLAYLPDLAPERAFNFAGMMLFWSFFTMTTIILCDATTNRLARSSLLEAATTSGRGWLRFLTIGALGGLMVDGIAQWLGKLWIYPFWNAAVYGSTFVVGFCAYWLAVVESYAAVKAVLKCVFGAPANQRDKISDSVSALFRTFGLAGAALIVAGVLLLLRDYSAQGGYVFEIRRAAPVRLHFEWFLLAFLGCWLVLEWAQHRAGRLSLIQTLLDRNLLPLCSLLIASALFSIFMETVNASHHFWTYTNWPRPDWQLWGVPVTVLLTWPLQYVVFLSLAWLLGQDHAAEVWR